MSSQAQRRPLIVVIDEDDDIGSTIGKSLVAGYENVLKAAMDFAVQRPEDSDSNAIFAGLNLYRQMELEGKNPEIVVVGGHPTNTLMAQDLVRKRVAEFLSSSGSSFEFYIVSDGLDELLMAEVLRDLGPIAGVRRVVVEQSLGVEGSYILLARYIRKALNDPRYSRYFVGIPGVLLLVFGVMTLFGYLMLALKVVVALLGVFMVIKGFNVEEATWNLIKSAAIKIRESGPFQVSGLGLLLATLTVSAYYLALIVSSPGPLYVKIGSGISYPLTAIIVGVSLYILIGEIFLKLSRRSFDVRHDAEALVTLIFLALGLYYLGQSVIKTPVPSLASVSTLGSYVYAVLVGSGFLTLILIGASIAAIIEIYYRAKQE